MHRRFLCCKPGAFRVKDHRESRWIIHNRVVSETVCTVLTHNQITAQTRGGHVDRFFSVIQLLTVHLDQILLIKGESPLHNGNTRTARIVGYERNRRQHAQHHRACGVAVFADRVKTFEHASLQGFAGKVHFWGKDHVRSAIAFCYQHPVTRQRAYCGVVKITV